MLVALPLSAHTLFPSGEVTKFVRLDLPLEKLCRLSQITLFSMCLSRVFRRIFWRYQILEYQNFQFPLVMAIIFSVACQRKDTTEFLQLVGSLWKKKTLKGLLYIFPSVTYVYGVRISIYLTEKVLWIKIPAEYLPLIIHSSSISCTIYILRLTPECRGVPHRHNFPSSFFFFPCFGFCKIH